MATIAGPRIQMPPAISQIAQVGQDGKTVAINIDWASLFHSLQQTTFAMTRSGPTASRPTGTMDGRFIGMQFYDTTLGEPVFLHSVNPDVWHNGAGAAV